MPLKNLFLSGIFLKDLLMNCLKFRFPDLTGDQFFKKKLILPRNYLKRNMKPGLNLLILEELRDNIREVSGISFY